MNKLAAGLASLVLSGCTATTSINVIPFTTIATVIKKEDVKNYAENDSRYMKHNITVAVPTVKKRVKYFDCIDEDLHPLVAPDSVVNFSGRAFIKDYKRNGRVKKVELVNVLPDSIIYRAEKPKTYFNYHVKTWIYTKIYTDEDTNKK